MPALRHREMGRDGLIDTIRVMRDYGLDEPTVSSEILCWVEEFVGTNIPESVLNEVEQCQVERLQGSVPAHPGYLAVQLPVQSQEFLGRLEPRRHFVDEFHQATAVVGRAVLGSVTADHGFELVPDGQTVGERHIANLEPED